MDGLGERLRAAHGDLWQAEGSLRESAGGGVLELPGARLMSSGLDRPEWNGGDVTDVERFDLQGAGAWYAGCAHGAGVPWSVRVPVGAGWRRGTFLHTSRLMGLARAWFRGVPPPTGLIVHRAGPDDLDVVAQLEAAACGVTLDHARAWTEPHLGVDHVAVALAVRDGEPAGVATGVLTDGRAGPCLGIVDVGEITPGNRLPLVSWLVEAGLAVGAELVQLGPAGAADSRDFAQLGFVERPGLDVYRMT